MILAVTAQQAEVFRYMQVVADPLVTVALILRSPDDFIDPVTRQPITPVIDETTGIVLRSSSTQYGVLPPTIVQPVLPGPGTFRSSSRHPGLRLRLRLRLPDAKRSAVALTGDGRSFLPSSRHKDLPPQMADQIRVLVVDDIPETRDHLTKLLGFESDIDVVGAAASGREALEMAVRLNPDVVLMDINMPDMDGITATEQLSSSAPGCRGRHDVRPGRSRLPSALHAGRRPRVPRQAIQQRRAHRLDPSGERTRT